MALISTYEAFLYFVCLLLIAHCVLGHYPKISILVISFFAFIPLLVLSLSRDENLYNLAFAFFFTTQFIFLKLIFKRIRILHFIFLYIFIDSINTLLISTIAMLTPFNSFLVDFSINTLTAALCAFACLTKIRIKIKQIIDWSPIYMVVVVSLLLITVSLLSLLITGASGSAYQEIWNRIINLALIALLFAVCIVFPILVINSISNNQLKMLTINYEQQIKAQAEHYKNLAIANFETRRFKHDFKNMSIAIEKLLADGNYDQALKLIQECNNTLNGFRSAFDTGNGIADALLTDKSEKASAFNAEITFNGSIPQEFLSPTDLCVILGNTLDNAIEACQKLDPKMNKTIAINCNCSSGFLFLSITNPVSEKVIIHDNHVTTTKANKTLHGFGLYSLHSIVKKYDGEVKLSSTDDCFTVDIDLCVKSSQKRENCLPQ